MTRSKSRGKKNEARRMRRLEAAIQRRAAYSLAILGMAFVHGGSGRFLNLRSAGDRITLRREAQKKA